ncbi:ATP synthase F1 subunit delta [Roseivirga sp. BDSF3-8]|uniref:ATP synthase F1 subunit delta n=1 Tax=Roseivirga sp. BDSF3-8 TaxID=3241598 RepID=UPI00353233DF
MSDIRVASRYAKSILELSVERGLLEDIHKDMRLFSGVVKDSRDFELLLKNPVVPPSKKLSILKSIFEGKVNNLTLQFFEIITRKSRESFLPLIAKEFRNQYNIHKGIQRAEVITTFPLSEELRTEFLTLIKKETGKEIELKEKVDPAILGGFILKIGDRQIDDSVSSKLKELRYKLTDDSYVKKVF